jgi:hypothetical protein
MRRMAFGGAFKEYLGNARVDRQRDRIQMELSVAKDGPSERPSSPGGPYARRSSWPGGAS